MYIYIHIFANMNMNINMNICIGIRDSNILILQWLASSPIAELVKLEEKLIKWHEVDHGLAENQFTIKVTLENSKPAIATGLPVESKDRGLSWNHF